MKRLLSPLLGSLLIFSAALGLLLSLLGIVVTWAYQPVLTSTLQEQVRLAESVMESTAQGLEVASQTLAATHLTLQTLDETVQTFSQSITDTLPLLDTIGEMVGKDLPATIQSTQTSLDSAQQSARVIEGVLRTLTAIPFFPGEPYAPQVPLHVALGDVSTSLNGLPPSFRAMQDNLNRSSANLATAQADIQNVRHEVRQVKDSLQQAQAVLGQYRQAALGLSEQLAQVQLAVPRWTHWGAIFLTLFWVWLGTAQIGLLTQGIEITQRAKRKPDE
ncbi:MAG: hypothetical protein ANABAC_1899 [Anaerolineae bacterium]|jgi:hypothetical protein|nr:MAG: hypothetical protein ANABAC_1899 [Anaerolineae bacterium]